MLKLVRYLSVSIAVAMVLGHLVLAADPNFSGQWKPDTRREGVMLKIEHSGQVLNITRSGPRGDVKFTLKTDGSLQEIPSFGDMLPPFAGKGTVTCEGSKLQIKGVATMDGKDYPDLQIWELSPDGKTLTVDRTIGERQVKHVFQWNGPWGMAP